MAEAGRAGLLRVAAFALIYALLQFGYQSMRDSPGSWLIDRVTVVPAAALIDGFFPSDGVVAQGNQLQWPLGRLRLLAGCDGFEVLTLYLAAVLVAPVSWRRGLLMLAAGTALIWVMNQGRIVGLYLAFRHWREGFDVLHTVWGPLVMIAVVFAFFAWNLRRER
jgi:exosortase/archaeosortase family protein